MMQSISPSHSKRVFNILVLGDTYVGKTSITFRFCEKKLLKEVEAYTTIGVDFRERTVSINGEDIKLQIWDTAGQERFRKSMENHYYRNAHGVIIVYDVTNMSSFTNVAVWLDECKRHNVSDQIPMILVGNKCDHTDVEVSTNLAQRIADAHGMPVNLTRINHPCSLRSTKYP